MKLCFFGVFNSLNLIKKTKVYKNHHILQLVPMDNRQYGRNHYAYICVCVCVYLLFFFLKFCCLAKFGYRLKRGKLKKLKNHAIFLTTC